MLSISNMDNMLGFITRSHSWVFQQAGRSPSDTYNFCEKGEQKYAKPLLGKYALLRSLVDLLDIFPN